MRVIFVMLAAMLAIPALAEVMNLIAETSVKQGVISARLTSGTTVTIPVQKVMQPRPLTERDWCEIRRYECIWQTHKMSAVNRESLRAGLVLGLELDIIHTPIDACKEPRDIFMMYQLVTQMLNRVRYYVRIPTFSERTKPAEAEILALETVNICRVGPITIEDRCPTPTTVVPCATGAVCFDKEGLTPGRYPATVTGASTTVDLSLWWYQQRETKVKVDVDCPQPPKPPKPPKPPDNTCPPLPPGQHPPEPPVCNTTPGVPANPSGPVPGGCPLPANTIPPNVPTTQPNHGTAGQAWDPKPTAPTVQSTTH